LLGMCTGIEAGDVIEWRRYKLKNRA